jgi:hypothetical protein
VAYEQSAEDAAAGMPRRLRLHAGVKRVEHLSRSTIADGVALGVAGSMRVIFTDGRVGHYDVIIAATGFRFAFPFLDGLSANEDGGSPQTVDAVQPPNICGRDRVNSMTGVSLVANGHGVRGLVHNLVPRNAPSMCFPTLSYGIAPFQLAYAQAEFCATYWTALHANASTPVPNVRLVSQVTEANGRQHLGLRTWRHIDALLEAAGRPAVPRTPEIAHAATRDMMAQLPIGTFQESIIDFDHLSFDRSIDDGMKSVTVTVPVRLGASAQPALTLRIVLPPRYETVSSSRL